MMKYAFGVIVTDQPTQNSEILFLCLRVYNNWDFPKGEVEEHEHARQTAVREVLEETNLEDNIDFVMSDVQTPEIIYGSGKKKKTASYYLARRSSTKEPTLLINPELGKAEHDEYRWVPLSKLRELMPDRFAPIITFLENKYQNKNAST